MELKDDERVELTAQLSTAAGNPVPFEPDRKLAWSTPSPEVITLIPTPDPSVTAEAVATGPVGVATITATDGVRTATLDITVAPGEVVAFAIVPGVPVKRTV